MKSKCIPGNHGNYLWGLVFLWLPLLADILFLLSTHALCLAPDSASITLRLFCSDATLSRPSWFVFARLEFPRFHSKSGDALAPLQEGVPRSSGGGLF